MAMGWWKPYFFIDLKSIQLLHKDLVLDGTFFNTLIASLFMFCLALLDRYVSNRLHSHSMHQHKRVPSHHALLYTLQKCSGGLLMLILMSFNLILFMEVVLFCGFWEYVFLKRSEKERKMEIDGKRSGGVIEFSPLNDAEI